MKTTAIINSRCFRAGMFLTATALILISCSPKLAVQKPLEIEKKPLTFTDVEKEFHFSKPLSEQSQKTILKKFGTVQNYHDSIVVRTNRKDKGFILSARPISADSVECRLFHITDEEVKRKGRVAVEDSISILINAGSKK